ncbi:glycosyltransferase family 2 protein [Thiohalophilus sp.]|uniref:glycosyltransferase family 2 protein n=1 Tax=Thiohalophilus sp. TaxID=3028392 RepID=UPI002ACDDE18|nr:glycosyltransferase family 2 protein [Thiohalophilus sp.]MDZ7662818.1 glycosyltransferase family 2 protein [Thiohalophilus sp.]
MLTVSIITVCFNSASTIRDTIESVRSQNYPDIEYIIIDGGSTDGTLEIVKEYDDSVSVLISEPDQGIYDAMNKGIRAASGDFVGLLNSDDILFSQETISELADFLSSRPDIDAVFGDLVYVDRNNVNQVTRYYSSKNFSPWQIRFGLIFPHPTLYVRPEVFRKLGLYKLNYRVAADFEMMARIIMSGVSYARNPRIMVKMSEGGISSTGFWWRIHQNMEIVRACRKNGIYTNIFLVMLKIPFKLASYLKR